MDPVFDFYPGGELENDEVDEVEVELGGNSNPLVSTNADVVDVQDDTVVEIEKNRLKRKLPPKVPKPKKERYRSPAWDHFNEIKEGGVIKWAECDDGELVSFEGGETIELLRWVKFCYIKTKGKEVAEGMEKRVKGVLDKLYDAYANEGEVRVQVPSATPSVVVDEDEDCDDRLSLANEFDTYLEQEYSSVWTHGRGAVFC
ncbi:hypothetical protein RHMOL_Rhmol10G0232000 [Rhododendron molle]|uniref:Uncharacterized protein n=1 Tax=Rhododendron molle TaxID=49168 RepID=A0ACC0M6C2_RHOML|nr:hypothetical protein RHMOL_Rhmol10G0232000 [Rhododendron molle]